ncbi:MAG: hypothetical protein CMF59_02490 [Leptospiraceae bacterium]|nr:hypothetical protein [Leptospiraceae bacterium]
MTESIYHPTPRIRRSVVRDILAFHNRPDMVPFAGGLPDPATLPVAAIARSAQYVLARQGAVALQYGTTEGYEPLRQYIANYLSEGGFPSTADEILITSGSQQGMDLISRWLLQPGDPVYTVEPLYNGALQNFEGHGASIYPLATDNEGPLPSALQHTLKDRHENRPGGFVSLSPRRKESRNRGPGLVYLQPTLDNPSGRIVSPERRRSLARAMTGFSGWLLEEDPYGELMFDRNRFQYISSFRSHQSLLLGSFSKIVSPSLRIGWIRAPRKAIDTMLPLKQSMDLHTNLFSQMVLHRFLEDTDLQEHLNLTRKEYARKQKITLAALKKYGLVSASAVAPAGGMFLWLRSPVDSDELAKLALKYGVAIVPGSAFFSQPEDGKEFYRLNFTAVDMDSIEVGVERLARAMKTLQGSVATIEKSTVYV